MAKDITLDKTRHFGTCHPPEHGGVFYQDGLYFGAEGEVCRNPELFNADAEAKYMQIMKHRAGKAAARRAFVEATGEEPKLGDLPGDEMPAATGDPDKDKETVLGWAKGVRKLQWFEAKKLMLDVFHYDATSKQGAVEWLIDNKHLAERDVK